MTVFWSGNASGTINRFQNKHIHIVNGTLSLAQMRTEGERILRDRRAASSALPRGARERIYGRAATNANTLVVVNQGSFQSMNAWVETNARLTGTYAIPVSGGVIVQAATDIDVFPAMNGDASMFFTADAKVDGAIEVDITVDGVGKHVYHLRGVADQGIALADFKMSKGGVSFTM